MIYNIISHIFIIMIFHCYVLLQKEDNSNISGGSKERTDFWNTAISTVLSQKIIKNSEFNIDTYFWPSGESQMYMEQNWLSYAIFIVNDHIKKKIEQDYTFWSYSKASIPDQPGGVDFDIVTVIQC